MIKSVGRPLLPVPAAASATIRRRPPEVSWAMACILLGVIAWGVAISVDRAQLTPAETVEALSSEYRGFSVAGVEYHRNPVRELTEEGEDFTVVSLGGRLPVDSRNDTATLIYYRVYESSDAAGTAFDVLRRESRAFVGPQGERRFTEMEGLPSATFCVETWSKWCNLVLGSTLMEVDSRLPLFDSKNGYQLRPLIRSAIAHYEAVTAGR